MFSPRSNTDEYTIVLTALTKDVPIRSAHKREMFL